MDSVILDLVGKKRRCTKDGKAHGKLVFRFLNTPLYYCVGMDQSKMVVSKD